MRCNQSQTISDGRFSMKILSEIARISDRILVENRSLKIADRKLPISDSLRHGFFLQIGNRQFPMGKNDSVRNGVVALFFAFVFMPSLQLCRCSSDLFLSNKPRTFRIGTGYGCDPTASCEEQGLGAF